MVFSREYIFHFWGKSIAMSYNPTGLIQLLRIEYGGT